MVGRIHLLKLDEKVEEEDEELVDLGEALEEADLGKFWPSEVRPCKYKENVERPRLVPCGIPFRSSIV